jgi:hypothetical protein
MSVISHLFRRKGGESGESWVAASIFRFIESNIDANSGRVKVGIPDYGNQALCWIREVTHGFKLGDRNT